jgi:hypothetical protein
VDLLLPTSGSILLQLLLLLVVLVFASSQEVCAHSCIKKCVSYVLRLPQQ